MFSRFAGSTEISVALSSGDIASLACSTVGHSAADISNIIKDACMWPLRSLDYENLLSVSNEEVLAFTHSKYNLNLVCFCSFLLNLFTFSAGNNHKG